MIPLTTGSISVAARWVATRMNAGTSRRS